MLFDDDRNVIFTYTRAQAIEDGVLVNLSDLFPEECQQVYKYNVACTANVWALIERACERPAVPVYLNETAGVVWDILYMSVHNPVVDESESSRVFEVIIRGGGPCDALYGNPRNEIYRLRVVVGPGDAGEPVVTFMFPNED